MRFIRCDRCGKILHDSKGIELANGKTLLGISMHIEGLVLRTAVTQEKIIEDENQDLDLCDDCLEKVYEFLFNYDTEDCDTNEI